MSELNKMKEASDSMRQWLLENGHYDCLDLEEEAELVRKGKYIDEPHPDKGYDAKRVEYTKKLSVIFKKQGKELNTDKIVSDLYYFRPVYKKVNPESDIAKFVSEKLGIIMSAGLAVEFRKVIGNIAKDGFNLGGQNALDRIKNSFIGSKNPNMREAGSMITSSFNLKNKDILNQLEMYAADRVKQINDTTRTQLRDVIVNGYIEGIGPNGIKNRIKDLFTDFSVNRAKTISLTELSIASGTAANESYIRRGIPMKSWLPRGLNICPICLANSDAGTIATTSDFPSGDRTTPAHPSCLCTIVPEIGDFWCGGETGISKTVFQSEDKCPGYTWYGGS